MTSGERMRDAPVVRTSRFKHTLVITIDRPEVHNCVDARVHLGVGRALEEAAGDPDVWVVVLTGAGERTFCAGADLKALARGERLVPDDPVEAGWGFAGYVAHHIGKPTIAAVNGAALGGGTELVLASDLAVASRDAVLGLPEVSRGVFASGGGVFRLPERIPPKRAMELMLTGERITADEALELGLVNAVVAPKDVLAAALALADRIAGNAPIAVSASERIARGVMAGEVGAEVPTWEQNVREQDALRTTHDYAEGPRAFAERRTPEWLGR